MTGEVNSVCTAGGGFERIRKVWWVNNKSMLKSEGLNREEKLKLWETFRLTKTFLQRSKAYYLLSSSFFSSLRSWTNKVIKII